MNAYLRGPGLGVLRPVAVAVTLFLLSAVPTVTAQTAQRSITVLGEGVVRAEPDQALVRIGVETFAPEVEPALAENRGRMNAVLEALAAAGIERRNIQTAFYNVFFERNPPTPEGPSGAPPGGTYRVSNMVTVTTRDLDRLGAILDSAIGAGANQVWGIDFMASDPGQLAARARGLAMRDALAQARQLAELAGVQLGPVLNLSSVIGVPGGGPVFQQADGLGGATPVSPGEITFRVQLQATWGIE